VTCLGEEAGSRFKPGKTKVGVPAYAFKNPPITQAEAGA